MKGKMHLIVMAALPHHPVLSHAPSRSASTVVAVRLRQGWAPERLSDTHSVEGTLLK
jgi:hypothetical protein